MITAAEWILALTLSQVAAAPLAWELWKTSKRWRK